MFDIFKKWNPKAQPHTNARAILWQVRAPGGPEHDQHKRHLARTGEDGEKLLALRKHYEAHIFALSGEISSMREAVSLIDESLARLVAHEAWKAGYEAAECDLTPVKKPRKKQAVS